MDRRSFLRYGLGAMVTPQVASGPWITAGPSAASEDASSPEGEYASPQQGRWRRLFLDATVVEEQHGLERVFHQAQKHPANPILRCDRPWEKGDAVAGPYVYGTVMQDGGRLRMWYQIIHEGQHIGYAESPDGIQWKKPALNLIPYPGASSNNLVVSAAAPQVTGGLCHNPSVIRCPWEPDPSRRYVMFGYDYGIGPRAAYSPDGLRWRYPTTPQGRGLFPCSDVVNFFRDTLKNRLAATWKTHSRRGRAVGVAWSSDGETWTKPWDGPVFVADDLDPDATQVYGMPVFPYQGLYIGLAWVYHARYIKLGRYSAEAMLEAQADSPRTVDTQLTWSWDLVNWTRPPERAPFIPRGGAGEFDAAMIYTARAPVVRGNELYFYYGGCLKPHDEPRDQAAIGLATLRLDGFCSMHAEGTGGWLVTRRERLERPEVTINARTAADGYVQAELLGPNGTVLPGFSARDCRTFSGDATAHHVRWRLDRLPPATELPYVRIRFHLRNADLFSYLPAGTDSTDGT